MVATNSFILVVVLAMPAEGYTGLRQRQQMQDYGSTPPEIAILTMDTLIALRCDLNDLSRGEDVFVTAWSRKLEAEAPTPMPEGAEL